MNNFKFYCSSIAILGVTLCLAPNNAKASTISSTMETLSQDNFKLTIDNDNLTLSFNNSSLQNKINSIKLISANSNKSFEFNKNSSNFSLDIDKPLENGLYYIIFNTDSTFLNEKGLIAKQLFSTISINNQTSINPDDFNVTSMDPIISIVKNTNSSSSLLARLPVFSNNLTLNSAKIVDSTDVEISSATNLTNFRNLLFPLNNFTFNNEELYYILFDVSEKSNTSKNYTVRVPFSFETISSNARAIDTIIPYTATENTSSKNLMNLSLNLSSLNPSSIRFFVADNPNSSLPFSIDSNGLYVIPNIGKNSVIGMELTDQEKTYIKYFKSPSSTIAQPVNIDFMNFVNESGFSISKNGSINLSLNKQDLSDASFPSSFMYMDIVYYNEFGDLITITDEKRVTTDSNLINLKFNTNISNITDQVIYVRVKSGTSYRLTPFMLSNVNYSSNPLSFKVSKSSTQNTDKINLTLTPNNPNFIKNFSINTKDTITINDDLIAKFDGKSFSISANANEINDGVNTYTFSKLLSNGESIDFSGSFIVDKKNIESSFSYPIESITPIALNSDNYLLGVDIDDNILNKNTVSKIEVIDEFGNKLNLKYTIKQRSGNKYIEININPANQLLNGMSYLVNMTVGTNVYKSGFVFSANQNSLVNLDLTFNSDNKFTLEGLDSIPGNALYNFNIKIRDNYRQNEILYANHSFDFSGEKITKDIITRNLNSNEQFIDGEKYLVEITNTSTGQQYSKSFLFRESFIDENHTENNSDDNSDTTSSNKINISNDSVVISTSISSSKIIKDINSNFPGISLTYDKGKITLENIVPNKLYKDFTINLSFTDGTTSTLKLPNFTTLQSSNKLKNYIAKVYTTTLTPLNESDPNKIRFADEKGLDYWYKMLSNKAFNANEFIFRILDENEFNSVHKTSEQKISALYPIIVNRFGDVDGLEYWLSEYDKLRLTVSESTALNLIITKMLNEKEPKQFFSSLGILDK